MLFFNIVCLFYVTVLIDSHPISKTIARFKKVDDTVDSITDLDYSREEQRRNDIFHENLRHKCKREDFDPMKTNDHTHATENSTIKIVTLPEKHEPTKKKKLNFFWQNFKTHKRIHKPKKETKGLKTKNKTCNTTIYDYKYDPMFSDSDSVRDEEKATVRFNRQIPKHSYEAFNQTNQMFPTKTTTTVKSMLTTMAISESTGDTLKKSLEEITKKVTDLKLKYTSDKDLVKMTTKSSTKITEPRTTTNKETAPTTKLPTTAKSNMSQSTKSTLTTDSWNEPKDDMLGIQQIEILLNNLKSRAFGLMTEQSPSVSELVYNAATETTFEVDPLLNHLQVTKPMQFTTLLIGTKNSNYKRNTEKSTTPSMRSVRDISNEDAKLILLLESSPPAETSSLQDSAPTIETPAPFQASTPPKPTFPDKILGQTNQLTATPGMLQNVENMLHKELLNIYKKLKNMLYENRDNKAENVVLASPSNQSITAKPAITVAVEKIRKEAKIGSNETKSLYADAVSREYRSFFNQSLPLSVYEALLNKIQKDNVMTMLSTAENYYIMPNVSEYLYTFPERQDRAKRFTSDTAGDPETTTDPYGQSNSNEMDTAKERKEYTNLSELKTELSYNNFVNGYKYYLDYQKERGQDRFSNQIKFQAHKHHKVDDIGKYILNKIPAMRNTRNIFDDSDMEYPDISTKSDDSWFKRHFYFHIESGPPKKYHTAEAVTLKPVTVKKIANFNVESKPVDHAIGPEDTEEPYRVIIKDDTTKYDVMDLLTGVNMNQLKLGNKYLHGYGATTPKYDRKLGKNYKFDKDEKYKKLDKDTYDKNYTLDNYIKQDKYKNNDIPYEYNYDGKKHQNTFQSRKLPGNIEENEGFVIKFIYDRNNDTTERKKKGKKKNRKKTTKLSKFKYYFETDLNEKVKRDLEDYYTAKDTDIRDARDDNILTTKATKSGKNDGYVNLDLLPQSTAVVNLYNSQKKPNKIRKFFRKYNFFKRKKFDNPKSKRELNRLEKLNPFLKIKHMFNKPYEKVITNQCDYDLINSHIDTFKPIKYSRLPNMDELKVQVPNISILTEEAIHIKETTTNKGHFKKPTEGRKLKVKMSLHPYMLPRAKTNEASISTHDANDLLYNIYTNNQFKNERSTTFNKIFDDNLININVLKDRKTTELIGDTRKHTNEFNRKHFDSEIGKNNVAHSGNAAIDPLEQRSYKFNEFTDPTADEEPVSFTEDFIKKFSSPKLRKNNNKKRKSRPHTISLNNKNIKLNTNSNLPKNKIIYDYFNDLMLWHSDILNLGTTPKYSTSNKIKAYDDVTDPVNVMKREQPDVNYAFKYPEEVAFVRNQQTFTFNSDNTQVTDSPDDDGIRWKRFFEKDYDMNYIPMKTSQSHSIVKTPASTSAKKKSSKGLPPVTLYKKPQQSFITPLPMDFEEFENFLKNHKIDVESVTSPLHQMTTLSDTWESKMHSKPDTTTSLMKAINQTTIFVNPKLTNKSAIIGYADFGDSELYSSYPEEQIEYLNEQLEYMEKELNDDEELVRRKRARKAKNVTSEVASIANSNISLSQIEEMLAEKKNGRVHALFKKLNHTMKHPPQVPHITRRTTSLIEFNSSDLGAEWKTRYLNDIKKKLSSDVEKLSDKFVSDGGQQPILKISGHGYHYNLWLGPSDKNKSTTATCANTDAEFLESLSSKTYVKPTKTTKIKDFGLSTYNTNTMTVPGVHSTVDSIHSNLESLEKSLGATKHNNLSGLFHLFSNKRRQSRSVFNFPTKAPTNSRRQEPKRNEILSILIEKYPKRKHSAQSLRNSTSMDLIPYDVMLRDKTNNLYITNLPLPTMADQFGAGMLKTMKDEKRSAIEANEFPSTPAISKLKRRSALVPKEGTYTAKNVAAIEVVIDLTRNNETPKPETKPRQLMDGTVTDGTVLNKCDKTQNCIQVRIAIPIDLTYKKRAVLDPTRIRKVFSAKLSNPVDLEYQIQSEEVTDGMITGLTTTSFSPPTIKMTTKKNFSKPSYLTPLTTNLTTKMTRTKTYQTVSSSHGVTKTQTFTIKTKITSPYLFTFSPNPEDLNASDLLLPGMYLLVNKHPNGSISLKQIGRNKINLQTENVENTTPNLKNREKFIEIRSNDKKIILSEDFIDTINDHLRLLYRNLTSANQNAKCFEKRHIAKRNNTAWEALKKYFGHEKVCKGKCRENATLCNVCAASEEVVNELSTEFENLAQYMNMHCTELQTFFYMNPKAGKKLRDMVHKIDKNLNDYYKRIKGKCQGKSCETFTTFIDKRFDKDIETGSSYSANNGTDDSNNIHYCNTLLLEKAMEKENDFIKSLAKCLPEKKRTAREAKMVKNVYSLDNINVNIICDPETTKLEPLYYDTTDPYVDVDPNPSLALYNLESTSTTKDTKKKSKKNIFTYIKGHKSKRDSDNEPGGSSWDDYILRSTLDDNEPTVKPRHAHKNKNKTFVDRLWHFSHPKKKKTNKRSKIDSTILKSSHKTTNEKSFVGRIWESPITTTDSLAPNSDIWMSTVKEKRNSSNMIDSMSMHIQKLIRRFSSGNTGHTTPQYTSRDNPYLALFDIEPTSKEFQELKNKSKKNIFTYYVERHKRKRDSSDPPLLSDAGGSFWKDYIIRGTRDGKIATKNPKSKETNSKTTHKKASKKSLIDKIWEYEHKSHKQIIGNKSSEAKDSRKHNGTTKVWMERLSSKVDTSNSTKSEQDSLTMHLQKLIDLYGSENSVRKYKEAISTTMTNNDIIFLTTKVYLIKNYNERQFTTTTTESYSFAPEEPHFKNISESTKSEECTKATKPMTKEYIVVSKSNNSNDKVTKKASFFNKMKKVNIFSKLFMDTTTPAASRELRDGVDLSHIMPTFVKINKTTIVGSSSTCPTIIIIENIRKKKRIGKRKVRNRFKRHFHSEFKSS